MAQNLWKSTCFEDHLASAPSKKARGERDVRVPRFVGAATAGFSARRALSGRTTAAFWLGKSANAVAQPVDVLHADLLDGQADGKSIMQRTPESRYKKCYIGAEGLNF